MSNRNTIITGVFIIGFLISIVVLNMLGIHGILNLVLSAIGGGLAVDYSFKNRE